MKAACAAAIVAWLSVVLPTSRGRLSRGAVAETWLPVTAHAVTATHCPMRHRLPVAYRRQGHETRFKGLSPTLPTTCAPTFGLMLGRIAMCA